MPGAVLILVALFGAGLLSAFFAGKPSFITACILAGLVLSYDLALKDLDIIGPINMGACRACNLLLGMSPHLEITGWALLFPLITLVYVFALTTLSRFEVNERLENRIWIVSGGWVGVITVLTGLGAGSHISRDSLIYLGLLALFTGPALLAGLRDQEPRMIGKAVKALILGIPLLDAIYVSGVHGWASGIPVALCIVPSVLLARRLYVT